MNLNAQKPLYGLQVGAMPDQAQSQSGPGQKQQLTPVVFPIQIHRH